MHDRVLVDTSAWIAFFRQADHALADKLKSLLRTGQPVYAGLIATELFRGARSKKELDVLEGLFGSIGYVETKEEYFRDAGELGRLLLHKGITIGTVDLLIAQIALANDIALLTLDTHFGSIARHAPLRLY